MSAFIFRKHLKQLLKPSYEQHDSTLMVAGTGLCDGTESYHSREEPIMLGIIDNSIPGPNGARCAVALTWDMDADSSSYLSNPTRADTLAGTALRLRYGPGIEIKRLVTVYRHLGFEQTFVLPGLCIETFPEAVD